MTNNAGQNKTDSRPQAAIAILYQENQFLLQLRDDNPRILYPGCWAFFGGHLEPGEAPEQGVQRELLEEIGYKPPIIHHFRSFNGNESSIIRHVFHAPLNVNIEALELNEGMDLGLASFEEIRRGSLYSKRLGEVRRLSAPHRQILLEFCQAELMVY